MYYLPFLIVCTLNLAYIGDTDTQATCLKFKDRPEIHYLSLADCSTRLREMVEDVNAHPQRLQTLLPGPWRYAGKCVIPVIDEVVT